MSAPLPPGIFTCADWKVSSLRYSSLHVFEHQGTQYSQDTGIKYVLSGTEQYHVGRRQHSVSAGRYLLVNRGKRYDTILPYSASPILGLCLSLNDALLSEVQTALLAEQRLLDQQVLPEQHFEFPEIVYHGADALGAELARLAPLVMQEEFSEVPKETVFFRLAEALLNAQTDLRKRCAQLPARNKSTQLELLRRLSVARQFMDDCFAENISVTMLAQLAALSEFHFFRTFRQLYGVTPHQYLLSRRLEKAAALLSETNELVNVIAHSTGFSDLRSFSKAFRKKFQCSPVLYRKAHA